MTKKHLSALLALTFAASSLQGQTAQQSPRAKESNKWRTLGAATGAGGGFLLGMAIGFAKFDDSVNSEKKVTAAAVTCAVAGAVGGYFIGRKIDKDRLKTTWRMDELDRSMIQAQQLPPPHVFLEERRQ